MRSNCGLFRKDLRDVCFQHGQLFLWREERALRALQLSSCFGFPGAELPQCLVGQVGVAFSASFLHFVLKFPGSLFGSKGYRLPVPCGQVLAKPGFTL